MNDFDEITEYSAEDLTKAEAELREVEREAREDWNSKH